MKILFLAHDTYRAGSQILLLGFLKFLKENHANLSFDLLVNGGGELMESFEQVTRVFKWYEATKSKGFFSKNNSSQTLLKQLAAEDYDLIYSSTILNGSILEAISEWNKPVITHVHEMKYWIHKAGTENLNAIRRHTTQYIAASEAVKKVLMAYDIPKEKINVVYEFTDTQDIQQPAKSLKQLLNLPDEALIIGACGAEKWRKGKDLFIPLAISVLQNTNLPVHFVWIGGSLDEELQYDLTNSGFSHRIHFVNHLAHASDYFSYFYLFLMLSREDPFPVVNLEAGARGVPILCFQEGGGTPELLAEHPECILPYLNLDAGKERIINLLQHPDKRNQVGKSIQEKILSQFDIQQIGASLVDIIKNI